MKATNGAKLEIDKVTGSFQYATEIFTEMVYEDKLTNVLSEKEYIRKSVDFLQKYNMCFESLDLTNAKVQPLMTIETVENGKEVEYVRLMGVYLYRKPLSGIKFDGVGPRVTVAFDNSGEIVSIHSAWREVKEVKTIPLIDNKGLLQLIEREQYSCSGFLNSDAKLTAIDVIYYMDPIGIEQKYAIPMYKITGTDADDNLIQAYAYAIEESSFKIIAPPTHDSKGGINTIDEKEKYLQEIMKENDGGVSSDGKDENIEDRAARGLN